MVHAVTQPANKQGATESRLPLRRNCDWILN